MKYFTAQVNSAMEALETTEEQMKFLEEINKQYNVEHQKVKRFLPKSFLEEWAQGYGIHDRGITQIAILPARRFTYSVSMELSPPEKNRIILHKAKNFRANGLIGQTWLYHEILPVGKHAFSLEIAFSNGGSLYVEFEKMEFKKGDTRDK